MTLETAFREYRASSQVQNRSHKWPLARGERLCLRVADHHWRADRHPPEAPTVTLAQRLGFLQELGRALLIDLRHRWRRLDYHDVRQECRVKRLPPVTCSLSLLTLSAYTVHRTHSCGGAAGASVETLTAKAVDSVNTFEAPNAVTPKPITAKVQGDRLVLTLEARSVTVVSVR